MAETTDKAGAEAGADNRPRIEDYGFVRTPVADPNEVMDFMTPYVGPDAEWTEWEIKRASDGHLVNSYGLCPARGAYATFNVFLTAGNRQGARRVTDMRYRDMIVDHWLAAGAALRGLRWVGTSCIINKFGQMATRHEFWLRGRDYMAGGAVELRPADALYGTCVMLNPFVRGLDALARSLNRRVRRFVFATLGDLGDLLPGFHWVTEDPVYYLVMEMADPDEPEDPRPGRSLNLSPEHRELLEHMSLIDWVDVRYQELLKLYNGLKRQIDLPEIESVDDGAADDFLEDGTEEGQKGGPEGEAVKEGEEVREEEVQEEDGEERERGV